MRTVSRRQIKADDTPQGRLIGYARVSTEDQDLEMQTDRLLAVGVHPDNIHTDKSSALAKKRPGLDLALKDCVPGDTLVVWKLDRFGRSLHDLLTKLKALEARGVGFRSLTESIDTRTSIGNLLLAVLGAVAQFERDLIAERTRAGIAYRKSQGAKFGPKHLIDIKAATELFKQGYTPRQVRDHFNLKSISTVYRYFDRATVDKLHKLGARTRTR